MKKKINELAIFGGSQEFSESLHVGRPNIGDRQRLYERLDDMLDKKWLSNNGPYLREFEERIADYLGAKNCIAVCNGTIAMEIMERSLGLTGEVIVPAFTAAATPHSLLWQQITPVFCDIDPETHTILPDGIEELITSKTSGILAVHLWSRPCEIDRLQEIADRNNLKLLFDACHAFACTYKGQMIGNFGEAEALSFHATKFLNSFEGGAIITNNDKLAAEARRMVFYGFRDQEHVISIGTNGKMSEICAAMGLTSLEYIDTILEANYRNYEEYKRQLAGVPGIRFFTVDEEEKSNRQYIVVEIDAETTGISRDSIMKILRAENVLARRHFCPGCHNMEPYRTLYGGLGARLPATEQLIRRLMTLPTGTAVSLDDVMRVCGLIRMATQNGEEISSRLLAFS